MTEFGNYFKQPMKDIAPELVEIIKSIGHKKRLQILIELLSGPMSFHRLLSLTDLKKTALAHHLSLLLSTILIEKPEYAKYQLTADGNSYLRSLFNTYSQSFAVTKMQLRSIQSRPMSKDFINTLGRS